MFMLSTGERCFRFSRPMASLHGWWTPLVKPTRKQGLMSPPLRVKPNYSKSPQGCYKEYTLAPYLFIIVLDYVLREAIEGHQESLGLTIKPRQGRTVKAEKVTDLNFADDIALFSDQFQQTQDLIRNVEEASVFYQMQRRQNTRSLTIMLILSSLAQDDEVIEPVENFFKYLGSWISDSEHDVKVRKGFSFHDLQQNEKCGPQSCHEQQRSDCLEQLISLSYSKEVKRGP